MHFLTGTERFQPSAPGPSRHPPRTCALPVPFPATLPASEPGKSKPSLSFPFQSVAIKCWQHHGVCSVHWCQTKQDLIPILPSAHKKLQKTSTRVHSYHSESQNGAGESQGMERERRCVEVKNRQMRNNSPQESSILTETTTKKHFVTATSQGSPAVSPG